MNLPEGWQVVPVAWLNPSNGVVIDMFRKKQEDGYPQFSIPLYTRPDDKLRKAAEGMLAVMDDPYPTGGAQLLNAVENLRAALCPKPNLVLVDRKHLQ